MSSLWSHRRNRLRFNSKNYRFSNARVGRYWAWTAYLFAGTGFAMVIVVAIIAGGTAMLAYKDEIVDWIINKDYQCENCGAIYWEAIA